MNWSKVKSIMIVFLILVNLAFLSYIVFDNALQRKQNEQMAQATASLLQSRNISADEKLIADCAKYERVQSVYVNNAVSDNKDFAKKILGENAVLKSDNIYSSELGKIEYSGDFFNASAKENKLLFAETVSSSNAKKTADNYLAKIGIDTKKSQSKLIEDNNKYKIIYSKSINSLPIFRTELTVEMNSKGVVGLFGIWYNINTQKSPEIKLKSISGILVEYMNEKTSENDQINDISLGYDTLNPNTYHESMFLTPVWQISDNTGTTYLDARESN